MISAGAERVFWDISAHEFKPLERRLLLVIWMETLVAGRARARFPLLFFPVTGIRNREARKTIEALVGYGVVSADWGQREFGILPRSADWKWFVRPLCEAPGSAVSTMNQSELIEEPRLDRALSEVAHDQAASEQHGWANVRRSIDHPEEGVIANPRECDHTHPPSGGSVITNPGEWNRQPVRVITRQGECDHTPPPGGVRTDTRTREALAKSEEIDRSSELKLKQSGGEGGPVLAHWEHVLVRVKAAIGNRAWGKHGRKWIPAVQTQPDYFERLVGDCLAKGGQVRNPDKWMYHIAKSEGYWPQQTVEGVR